MSWGQQARRLIMQAMVLGNGGQIFVPDVGAHENQLSGKADDHAFWQTPERRRRDCLHRLAAGGENV